LLREEAKNAGLDLQVTLVEKEQRLGGKIWSIKADGFLCEWGPNGFLDNKPQTLELCKRLGADAQLLRSNDNARKRFIYSAGMLHRLPENGPSFLKSPLISWPGKLRLAMEPLIPQYTGDADETLAAFGRRRLGSEALAKLIAPMVSGIFAGDPETMSLKSCFPRIAELEEQYGGLIKAMIMLAKQKKKDIAAGKVVASAAGPGGVLTSFRDGIQTLTDTLATALGPDALLSGREVTCVLRAQDGSYRVQTPQGELEADAVVIASPAFAAAAMTRQQAPGVAELLAGIPYATMTVVCFGYERQRIARDLNGFGYLIPKAEGKSILGTLWDSSIFEHRAPAGQVLLRSMMGGACFPEYVKLPDEEVQRRVQTDLQSIMGIGAPPDFVRIFRHEQAIPQYIVGHGRRLAALEDQLTRHPGLVLTGNSYRGIGLNDCVAAAHRATIETLGYLQKR
jgi:oxygen-dependent protoporphyrinogen oxidase